MGTDTQRCVRFIKLMMLAALMFITATDMTVYGFQEQDRAGEFGPVIPGSAGEEDAKQSLASRMCGKYSYHIGGEENEFYTLHVISFGDNVYALCSCVLTEDYESFETYSFWADEFIPYDADEMHSSDSNKVRVDVMSFSVMANAGKFQGPGKPGTITVTDDGLLFEDFEDDEFLCPSEYGSRLFLRDERTEDVFPYLDDHAGIMGDEALTGLWILEDESAPVFLVFQDSNLFLYQKASGAEVFYAAGAYTGFDGGLTSILSVLGYGAMPKELCAEYTVSGDTLSAVFEGDVPAALEGKHTLRRADRSDIPVAAVGGTKVAGAEAGGAESAGSAVVESVPVPGCSYYAVFTAAVKERDSCGPFERNLENAGFDSYVIFTPDFSDLNPEPYYAVTAGLFNMEEAARKCLGNVKAAGFGDAYVKFTGEYTGK